MKTRRDDFDLAAELRALRPSPRPEFAAELDRRAAEGFPRERAPGSRLGALRGRLAALSPHRAILPAVAAAAAAIVVATALIATTGSEPDSSSGGSVLSLSAPSGEGEVSDSVAPSGRRAGGGVQYSDTPPAVGSSNSAGSAGTALGHTRAGRRRVERAAELTLAAAPDDVGRDAAKVFDAVHAVGGVVLRSTVRDAAEGRAGAEFELLIPAAKLGDALADLARIDEVRFRRESTRDITAPTVSVGERLADSRARIDGLLAQLASATSDGEREAVEAELRRERRHAAALRARLDRLRSRADFARVSLRIESGGPAGSASWGVDDALDDAGQVLTTAAGVALVGIAVLGPLALLALLAWLANRAWLRRRRERSLD